MRFLWHSENDWVLVMRTDKEVLDGEGKAQPQYARIEQKRLQLKMNVSAAKSAAELIFFPLCCCSFCNINPFRAGVFPPNTLDLQCRKTRPWRFKCEPLTLPDTWHQKTSQTQSCKKWQIYLPDLCYYSELVLNFELHTYTHVIRGKYYSFFLLFTGFIGKFMLFCRKLDYDIIYAFLVLNLGTTLHLWSTDNWHYS